MPFHPSLPAWMHPEGPVRLWVSACLLGEPVRWDGGHKRDDLLIRMAAQGLEWRTVCPEVAVGLGVPRPPIRLTRTGEGIRALGAEDPSLDPSAALGEYGRMVAGASADMDGGVLKSGSPSCGLQGVPVQGAGGWSGRGGSGLFASAMKEGLPTLPLSDERTLNAPGGWGHFMVRVMVYRRWRCLLGGQVSLSDLAEFHQAHRLTLLSHGAQPETVWKAAVEGAKQGEAEGIATYGQALLRALLRRPTARRHILVMGRLARAMPEGVDQQAIWEAIAAYGAGDCARRIPWGLLHMHFQQQPHPTATGQTYLSLHPLELLDDREE